MRKGQCLKRNPTEDGSVYLNIIAAAVPISSGLEPFDPTQPNAPLQDPGASNDPIPITYPTQTTPVEPPKEEPVQTPVQEPVLPAQEPTTLPDPVLPMPYSDPAIEMDYYNIGCGNLNYIISYINNKIAASPPVSDGLTKANAIREYYSNKLGEAKAAYSSLKCDVPDVVNINDPATVTNPAASTPTSITTPATTIPTTVYEPPPAPDTTKGTSTPGTTLLSPSPGAAAGGGGGGGGGGSDESSKQQTQKASKRKWWLLAICVAAYGFALYKGRNETL